MAAAALQCASFRFSCSCSASSFTPQQRLVSFCPPASATQSRTSQCCRAAPENVPATEKVQGSILCTACEGNGAVVCTQCKGDGLNSQDHFGGRYKAGTICWLCRGKKQTLCGNCNGAGFMGGFLNTQDE